MKYASFLFVYFLVLVAVTTHRSLNSHAVASLRAAVRILSPLTLISIESLAKIACGGHVC
jgi:hypothetical protein